MYNFKEIEPKWQKYWEDNKLFYAKDDFNMKKFYNLVEFPYPSGAGMHVGHVEAYASLEILSRKRRMEGYNVLFPIGFDAFGLPAENYAIKTKTHPKVVTEQNIANFTNQLKRVGFSFDWSRVVDTTDPKYYRWTQWIFLKLFENGLAFRDKTYVNYCPSCKVVLSNEDSQGGKCDICHNDVIQKEKEVWYLRITKYADKLLEELNSLDFLPNIKLQQENWIGKSTGAFVNFNISSNANCIIIHGCPDDEEGEKNPETRTYDKHWMQWLKKNLEEKGIKCDTPLMPEPWNPDYDSWKKQIEKHDINEKSILIGHSCGCSFLIRYLGETKKKVNKLILVAPWKQEGSKDLYDFKIDSSIKERVNNIYIFTSDNEEKVGKESAKLFNTCLGGELIELIGKGHYTLGHMGTEEFPELLEKSIETLRIYTTRPDTLYGVTFMVIAPEHPLIDKYKDVISNYNEIEDYKEETKKKTEFERTQLVKEKTGVKIEGITAINPVSNKEIPIYISDYVMMNYGTGAIMAVPAHDERDYDFAKKFNIPVVQVIAPSYINTGEDAPRKDAPNTKRNIVCIIIKHHTEDKYLVLDWKKQGWKSFVAGGIEEESIEDAVIREVKEETGYQSIVIDKISDFYFLDSFYASHKGVNREVTEHVAYVHIADDTKVEIDKEELEQHTPIWLNKEEVLNFINKPCDEFKRWIFPEEKAWTEDGVMINSGILNGINNKKESIRKMIDYLEENSIGEEGVQYKMKDWAFNRQRYWGEPIPIIYCDKCGMVPVPYDELPLMLPEIDDFEPGKDGESPLASISSFVNCKCPKCGGDAKRETDTMPQWAGSSWYFLRYIDPHNDNSFADINKLKYWLPIDWYNGGMEHVTRHLIYSRFWHRFLYDIGEVPTKEPYAKRTAQGMILGSDGQKMSKSRGNVVDPNDIVDSYGADTLRTYLLFMGEYSSDTPWNDNAIKGVSRFLDRVYQLKEKVVKNDNYTNKFESIINKTIKKVSIDIESMKYNTAISELMKLLNEYSNEESITSMDYEVFLKLLYPFAPHITEELNKEVLNKESLVYSSWPTYDESKTIDESYEMVVQVNGKLRGKIEVSTSMTESDMKETALQCDNVKKHIEGLEVIKIITIPKKLVNIVVK